MRGVAIFSVLLGAATLGCGSEVVVPTGGAGGATSATGATSGKGSATVGSTNGSTTNGAVTTGVTVGTTTGAGGASMGCSGACTKAESCGLPAGQCGMFLDCNTSTGQCLADCVNDPNISCADLIAAFQSQSGPFFACATGCQGMGMTTAASSTGTGMPPASCQMCGQQQCGNAVVQCFQNSGQAQCQGWLQCAQGCATSACLNNCTTQFPGGGVIQMCLCGSCGMQCGAVCP